MLVLKKIKAVEPRPDGYAHLPAAGEIVEVDAAIAESLFNSGLVIYVDEPKAEIKAAKAAKENE